MLWAPLALLSGLADAVTFSLMKKLKEASSTIIVWVQYAFALPFLLALLYFTYPQKIDPNVYWISALNGMLLLVSTFVLAKAAQISDLSVSMPMLSLTPLFLILTSYIMLNEAPTFYGFIGIVLLVFGAYVINIQEYRKGLLGPLKSLVKNKGSFYVIIVAFIWGISANLFKIGILGSNPVFFSTLVYIFISIVMLPFIILNIKQNFKQIKSNFNMLLALGIASAAMIILSSYPMLYAIVPYVISLKRSSVIFSIFFGYFMFKEKNIKNSIIGALIMLAGGILITVF